MGLLSEGSPLSWPETKKLANHVREHAVTQFINQYRRLKDRENDCLKWGDEVEYVIVYLDHAKKTAQVSLRANEILPALQEKELRDPKNVKSLWRPEFGAYMIEGTPGQPYGSLISHFNVVEANMKARRDEAIACLKKGEEILCVTTFPRLGCPGFTYPVYQPHPKDSNMRSLFFPDEATFPGHPRFRTLVRNIRERRGKKVVINVPIFKDKNTPSPFVEDFAKLGDDGEAARAALPDHVYMDSMGFGMGNCCLQVTFQACNISEARVLYDQLAPVCPIMLALSAASPAFRGYLTERDCRWNVIVSSVDDRTDEELGLKPLRENKFVIRKSRYSTIECYISELGEKYNDVKVVYDQNIYDRLRSADIDPLLAQHVAHLFIRDPISLFSEKVDQNDEEDTDHFENLQSTNWHSMRFKPPPPNSSIGWRVEFRPSELQMTEFENAAYVVFVVLLTRVILSYKISFLMPISKVDQNMEAAQKRDAVRTQKFWFRSDILTCRSPPILSPTMSPGGTEHHDYLRQMSINEIINGKPGEFPGLVPLIRTFVSSMDVDVDTQCTIQQYLNLIQRRASGELLTTASWIRKFITTHPEYKQDSVVSERINYDLLLLMSKIQDGSVGCPELFGTSTSKTKAHIPSAILNASSTPLAPGTQ
ncbi:glutamate--cysteine ligase catalytic subunit [Dermacentor andersoni]|uniref:glutamate--cysteine ligase catalytic subunit n=1 Tax=Dermacentor andersoni TaxID=34620 RepID=UPI002155A3C2|nr:glutamate--cysteine ligase-like [Dermacentor andersoni]